MSYSCDVCHKTIKRKSKSSHFESNLHREFDRCKHKKLRIENPKRNHIDEIFYAYIIEHNKNYEICLMEYEFKLYFKDVHFCPYITSELYSIKTMCYWYKF